MQQITQRKYHRFDFTFTLRVDFIFIMCTLCTAQCCWWWMSDNGARATFAKRQFAAITLHDCVGIYCDWHLIFGLIYLYRSISLFHSSLRLFCVLMPSAALLGSDEINRITTIFKRDNSYRWLFFLFFLSLPERMLRDCNSMHWNWKKNGGDTKNKTNTHSNDSKIEWVRNTFTQLAYHWPDKQITKMT